jgi:hypothetical protein
MTALALEKEQIGYNAEKGKNDEKSFRRHAEIGISC